MKKLTILFLLVAFKAQLTAQVSGYQGQRFSVGYNAGISFALEHLGEGLGLPDAAIPHLNYKSEISANITLSRKVNLCFQYTFAKQGYLFSNYSGYYTYNGTAYEPPGKRTKVAFSVYELHFQFYRKNFIAPTGLYNEFGVGIINYNIAGKDSIEMKKVSGVYYGGSGPNQIKAAIPLIGYSGFKLSYFIGKTNPLGHRVYINTAFGINLFSGGDLPNVHNLDMTHYFLGNMNHFIKMQNLFELRLGLGFFAF